MNLVQINERLKEMPLQVVQQYANGTSPEVPPYLALGELQRRETMQKQMATARGAAQGPQPSIKEQIEQKAGLMALQQMQQQQGAQPQVQPGGPIPGNVPQPVPQETAMAYGGLAALPVNSNMYNFDCGGIVAFDGETNGSYVDRFGVERKLSKEELEKLSREQRMRILGEAVRSGELDRPKPRPMELTDMDMLNIEGMQPGTTLADAMRSLEPPAPKAEEPRRAAPVEKPAVARGPYTGPQQYTLQQQGEDWVKRKLAAKDSEEKKPSEYGRQMSEVGGFFGDLLKKGLMGLVSAPDATNKLINVSGPDKKAGITAGMDYSNEGRSYPAPVAAEGKKPVINPNRVVNQKPPAASPAANAAAPAASPAAATESAIPGLTDPAFMEAAKKALEAPDEAKMIQAEMARRKAFGVEGKAGEEQERRLRDMMSEYERGKESRGLERLMEVLGGRSLGEMGTNYLNYENRQRAADRAQAMKMNELLGAIESGRRTEGIAGAKGIGESVEKRSDRASQLAGQIGAQQMQSAVSRENQLSQNRTQLQIAELDRALREKLHKTPAAQIPSIEREMLDVYTRQFNGDRAKAYEHLKTILQENKSELNQPQLIRKYVEDWNKLDPATRMNYEKQGIKTVDDYVAHMNKTTNRLLGGAQSGKSPTLPAGFQLDK